MRYGLVLVVVVVVVSRLGYEHVGFSIKSRTLRFIHIRFGFSQTRSDQSVVVFFLLTLL